MTEGKPDDPFKDLILKAQQFALSGILEMAVAYNHAVQLLQSSISANTEWETERWEPYMLEKSPAIAQKWKIALNNNLWSN